MPYSAGDEITVGHRTFSEHLWHLSGQNLICSAKLAEQHLLAVRIAMCLFVRVHIRCLDSLAEIGIFDGRSKWRMAEHDCARTNCPHTFHI